VRDVEVTTALRASVPQVLDTEGRRAMVAALFVQTGGCYFGVEGVDPWDEPRDARTYAGPHPVVAHPPCQRWCQLAPVNQARYGLRIGDDGGCFELALSAVRAYGGILEHPARSLAWRHFEMPRPTPGRWIEGPCGGWTAQVEQGHYGHPARKATWLYAHGVDLPDLKWGRGPPPTAWVSTDRPRAVLAKLGIRQLNKSETGASPPAFRDLLLSIARTAQDTQ
jgi:hypothetical protein